MTLIRDKAFIGGQWIGSGDGKTYPVFDPANSTILAHVPEMGERETLIAIDTANTAFTSWREYTAKQRAEKLMAWFHLIMEHQSDLAAIITQESGKPLAESMGEVAYGASFIQWFAEEGKRTYGDVIPTTAKDRRLQTLKQPVGVCAAITPWNFPVAMITRKVAPALAAGCTIVVKPAEATPLSALALVSLAQEAGIPDGVINVITASHGAGVGKVLCDSPDVRKLSFTGSTAVGKILIRQCADTVKRVSMELGGNAPFIVFDDADIDAAVEGAMASKFRNAGQTCVCANRILVQSGVYNTFAEKFANAVSNLKVGNGLEPRNQIGPLINRAALDKVESHIRDALILGARRLTGGTSHSLGGLFYQPTVLADVTPAMRIASEETFGPVAPLFRFEDEAEAIAMANDTEYGLAAYFYSRDIHRCLRVSEALEYGMVGVNEGVISNEVAPFGGVKTSGLGREGSRQGIEEYLDTKYVCFGGL
ncbi:NAD-dependent succinate-semialdehyde dehydrogenase [Grimontia hollisae]|uniref:Succinate-semialdehyde dehydrogenase n=1 Tax=Grimontia hollisae CIP 101886 TaxID=675812 RepID=D0I923_GRIHO|nr:NAD-dependent succinate-semialdehyde dehydrogenase [Grimontia hollisae]AMG29483.1 NAD-dependent succinate-semialdehyde dehydrogenase [Grimontia hollisae]EEY71938.1 succinate-semialdehyde dehydrogenase [Grimontia hollisae CIP 101886]MDF2184653.1 NAD-dependent succinate-semialdehyde dehydrogenase [Grimontia hollisae]STO77398.1 Succinate-semialdehyde dehydrogenase [NADP(+)] GabD [Grimontia hollisae]STQ75722.1 Succinate-semialdehyde dehydrogenase [NADP(+)] GabD [Grimontia hollisae]